MLSLWRFSSQTIGNTHLPDATTKIYILNSLKENNTLLAKGRMEGLVHCHCIRFSMCYILNCPPLVFGHQRVLHFDALLWQGSATQWCQSELEGLCWDHFSTASPEAAAFCLKQLSRMVNCFISLESQVQWIRESTIGASSQTASVFSTTELKYLPENSRYSNGITNQGFSAWPKIQGMYILLQMDIVSVSFAEGALSPAFKHWIVWLMLEKATLCTKL